MTALWYLLMFSLGASVGSFLNVIIMRSLTGETWVKGRSHCDNCGKKLYWYDMFPVISYLAYRGRSRCCRTPLSLQHPVVEALTGMLFVWWLVVGSFFFHLVAHPLSTLQPLFWLLIGIILIVIFVTDLFFGLIPTVAVYSGVAVVVVYRLILISADAYRPIDLWYSILAAASAALFFSFLRVITRNRGMGDGDVFLALLLGILLGWPKTLIGLLGSFVIGAVVSLILIIFGRAQMGGSVPFGPFMIAGIVVALMWSDPLIRLMGFN